MEIYWFLCWSCCLALLLPSFILCFSFLLRKAFSQSIAVSSPSSELVNSPPSPSDDSSSPPPHPSPLPLPSGEYEVFLSFRGPDTRNNIADFLYVYLMRSKIRTFRDDEELRKGEEIAPGLLQAIVESKIYIPILSKTYASSKWCLKELAQMVECRRQDQGHVIFPIFYLVDPGDVRHQRGDYEEAFLLHEGKFDEKTVQDWRDALEEVGKMKGWHVTDLNGQGSVVDQVFEKVLALLSKNYSLVSDELVGIDHHVEKVRELLDEDSGGVKVVGIHGMGGIGKTTIATAVYNTISAQFNRCSFLEDLRETLLQHEGIVTLQNKLISSITRDGPPVRDASEGIRVIKDRVCHHKVLIVLDDVGDKFEVGKILGGYNMFFPGSRFIITTRNKKVLTSTKECELYEPEEMSDDHSLQLFSKHAFGMDSPPKDYASLSAQVVSVAAGLPLTLKVVGSLLYGEDSLVWEDTLMQLKEIPPTEVLGKLKISYNALTYEEQQIFLDIACFFNGENREMASYMWNDCRLYPVSGINVLMLRSMIKIGMNNEFKMHDQLRDLGRAIVREENVEHIWKRSRVWFNEDALDMLDIKKMAIKLKVLNLVTCYSLTKVPDLSPLGSLEILNLHGCRDMVQELEISNLKNLKKLKLSYCGITKITGRIGMLQKLEELDAWECKNLEQVPDDIGSLPSLKTFKITSRKDFPVPYLPTDIKELIVSSLVPNLSNLIHLEELGFYTYHGVDSPQDLWRLSKLKTLELCETNIRSLPIALPPSLNKLSLRHCQSLEALPDLTLLKNLTELTLLCCPDVCEIQGLGELKSLVHLEVTDGESLNHLEGLQGLILLTVLEVILCPLLKKLPSLAALNKVQTLTISQCSSLTEIQGLGEMESLKHLEIEDCGSLQSLPDLSTLSKLRDLTLNECKSLQSIEGIGSLEALERLTLNECHSIKRFPSLSKLTKLKQLTGKKNLGLLEIQSLQGLHLLEALELPSCGSLERLPDMSSLKSLKKLDLDGCRSLVEVTGVEGLESLESLSMNSCWSIEKLPNIWTLKSLSLLALRDCWELKDLPGVEGLESLKVLDIHGCKSIESLRNVSHLRQLEKLSLSGCESLSELSGLIGLHSLKELNLESCTSLGELPSLAQLRCLEKLFLDDCVNLTEVLGLGRLESLQMLTMCGCISIERLENISKLKHLSLLHIIGCEKLKELPGLEGLESLDELKMNGCKSIEKLPSLSNLRQLERLTARGCESLSELQGVEQLKCLKMLDMGGCKSIEKLPVLSSLRSLLWLSVKDCEKLVEIKGIDELKSLTYLDVSGCNLIKDIPELLHTKVNR
ncbi:unnamed protein product [Linum tenue]|uniref:TIR domain-containing protein n=1 Tax=Linum tenue TaxID=586396 RepID=A0AAV0KMP8_9ROSI|nr:unnamed protein product [Linum tenue]